MIGAMIGFGGFGGARGLGGGRQMTGMLGLTMLLGGLTGAFGGPGQAQGGRGARGRCHCCCHRGMNSFAGNQFNRGTNFAFEFGMSFGGRR